MKIQITILTTLYCYVCIKLHEVAASDLMSKESYEMMVYHQEDRIVGKPLTLQKCYEYEREHKNLHSCKLAINNYNVLTELSTEFLSKKLNQWDDYSSKTVVRHSDVNYFGYNIQGRKKRSALVEHNEAKSRARRSIPGNPCVSHFSEKTTILYAVECESKDVREVLQDPGNLLFQTFYTYSCNAYKFFYFICRPQYMSFMTAVYTGPADADVVEVRCVEIPTHCSISIERRH